MAVKGVVTPDEVDVGVEHQGVLLAFVDAAKLGDQRALEEARDALANELGVNALVDAAAVVGNFERMTRIADGCGISLGMLEVMAGDITQELEISHFDSAANTKPAKGIKRLFMKWAAARMRKRMARAASARRQEPKDAE